jgi:hypothetical protein
VPTDAPATHRVEFSIIYGEENRASFDGPFLRLKIEQIGAGWDIMKLSERVESVM